jgi:hypothetical protein
MSLKSYLTESDSLYKKQIAMGIKVEHEHKDVYDYFKDIFKKHNIEMPLTLDEFSERIAKAHIMEASKWKNKDYYNELNKMEEKMKSGR